MIGKLNLFLFLKICVFLGKTVLFDTEKGLFLYYKNDRLTVFDYNKDLFFLVLFFREGGQKHGK